MKVKYKNNKKRKSSVPHYIFYFVLIVLITAGLTLSKFSRTGQAKDTTSIALMHTNQVIQVPVDTSKMYPGCATVSVPLDISNYMTDSGGSIERISNIYQSYNISTTDYNNLPLQYTLVAPTGIAVPSALTDIKKYYEPIIDGQGNISVNGILVYGTAQKDSWSLKIDWPADQNQNRSKEKDLVVVNISSEQVMIDIS